MTGPLIGDLEFQLRAGSLTRMTGCPGACDGQMFASPISGNTTDDMCPYITSDDIVAADKYQSTASGQAIAADLEVLCDATSWNGRQCVRAPGRSTSPFRTLHMADFALASNDLWFRGRYRVSLPVGPKNYNFCAVGMAPASGQVSSFTSLSFDLDGTVDPGFGGHYSSQLVITWGDSNQSFGFTSGPMSSSALVDGEWWDVVGHIQRNYAARQSTYHGYCRRSDGTGLWQSIAKTGAIPSVATDTGSWKPSVIAVPTDASQWVDVGAIEFVDGAAHPDPFGIGA